MELGEHPWTATLFYWIGDSYMTLAKDNRGDYVDKAKTKLWSYKRNCWGTI